MVKNCLCGNSGDVLLLPCSPKEDLMTNTSEIQTLTEVRALTETELDAVCGGHHHPNFGFGGQLSKPFNSLFNLINLFNLFGALEHGLSALNSFNTVTQSNMQIAVIVGNDDTITQIAQNNSTI
jgi:hypothetical protein